MTLGGPGCGFGFWHNWGVLCGLRPNVPIHAVSGSALAAVCYHCGLDLETELQTCARLRPMMLRGLLVTSIRAWLRESLPSDCAGICSKRVVILLRRVPTGQVVAIDAWTSKEDLIETLVAACNPIYPQRVRGQFMMDVMWYTFSSSHRVLPSKSVFFPPTVVGARELYREGRSKGLRLRRKK